MTDENNRPQSIVELDKHELACRILEGLVGAKRPEGLGAEEALKKLDQSERDDFYRAAKAAAKYILEYMQNRKGVH